MKIVLYPDPSTSFNSYINNIVDSIITAYPGVEIIDMPSRKKILTSKNLDFKAAWFNWFESLPSTNYYFFKDLIVKILVLKKLKKEKVKIITTLHNKQPHYSRNKRINKWFYKYLLKKSDNIIILNDKSRELIHKYIGRKSDSKIVKVSHPCYDIKIRKNNRIKDSGFTVLFFGKLRPYKNIEIVFELAKRHPDIKFIITGGAGSSEYEIKLKKLAQGLDNINLQIGHNSDEEIENYIDNSSVVVLPYHLESTLNSGVMIYAFSKGINVIMPELECTSDIKNKDIIYLYSYKNREEHLEKLESSLLKAYNDFKSNPEDFFNKGKILQDEIKKYDTSYLAKQIFDSKILESNNRY